MLYPVTGGPRDFARFYVLETVARVPYFAYLSVMHLRETFGERDPKLGERMRTHYAEADNELHHLLIMESLGGNTSIIDRTLAQSMAFGYYWYVAAVYSFSEPAAYHLSELIENHAYETYDKFLKEYEEKLRVRTNKIQIILHINMPKQVRTHMQHTHTQTMPVPDVVHTHTLLSRSRSRFLTHVFSRTHAPSRTRLLVGAPSHIPARTLALQSMPVPDIAIMYYSLTHTLSHTPHFFTHTLSRAHTLAHTFAHTRTPFDARARHSAHTQISPTLTHSHARTCSCTHTRTYTRTHTRTYSRTRTSRCPCPTSRESTTSRTTPFCSTSSAPSKMSMTRAASRR